MFLAHLIERLTHDAEVLLGCKRATEALGRCAIGHIVQQTLTGSTDHSYNIGTLARSCLSLHHVLIDVTRSHDDVEVGLGTFTDGLQIVFATRTACAYAGHALVDNGLQGLGNLLGITSDHTRDVQFIGSDLFGNLLRVETGLDHGIGDKEQRALAQDTLILQCLNHDVGQRHIVVINAIDAHQAAQRALNSHRRVLLDKGLHILGNALGQSSGILNFFKI